MRENDGCFCLNMAERKNLEDFQNVAAVAGLQAHLQAQNCFIQGGAAEQRLAAELVARLFFGPWEEKLLGSLADQRYDCFDAPERHSLLQKSAALAAEDDFRWGLFAGYGKEQRLTEALCLHWAMQPCLNWRGFLCFRLQGYREYLRTLLSIAADEVLSEQEHNDYLRLLRNFLAERPQGGDIHVFLFRQGMYDICVAGQDGLLFLEGGRLAGCEDMLIFSLLHLAPKTLCFHIERQLPPVLAQLLRDLFGPALRVEMLKAGPLIDQKNGS